MPSLRSVYIGSTAIALFLKVIYSLAGLGLISGSLIQTIYNGDHFLPFALILGVMYTIRTSHGQRSVTPWLIFLFLLSTGEGLLSFSKQALFSPAFCWVLAAAICRYRLKVVNIIVLAIVAYVAYAYATPYSQYGRTFAEISGLSSTRTAAYLLTHMDEVVKGNAANTADVYGKLAYYDHSMGLFDRLQMLSPDDALIGVTEQYGPMGYEPLIEGAENIIPRIFWPDKPFSYFGNLYGHQIGAITDDDSSTSVSFGISADLYREGGLSGVLLVGPLCMAAVFFVVSWFLGDVRSHPAAIIAVLVVAHTGPEGGAGGLFGMVVTTQYMVILAFACRYVLPVVSSIFDHEKAGGPTAERTLGMA